MARNTSGASRLALYLGIILCGLLKQVCGNWLSNSSLLVWGKKANVHQGRSSFFSHLPVIHCLLWPCVHSSTESLWCWGGGKGSAHCNLNASLATWSDNAQEHPVSLSLSFSLQHWEVNTGLEYYYTSEAICGLGAFRAVLSSSGSPLCNLSHPVYWSLCCFQLFMSLCRTVAESVCVSGWKLLSSVSVLLTKHRPINRHNYMDNVQLKKSFCGGATDM